ncbi:MAG TPA: hypothetical protein GX717_01490 [Clostridiaceae bacterium]|nr:hypothetical protein [Clostridiaceae bacterium]
MQLIDQQEPIVVFGLGDFSDVVSFVLAEKLGAKIVGYTVNEQYLTSTSYRNRPVYPFETIEEIYPPSEFAMVIGFIGKKMFDQRAEVFRTAKAKGYRLPNVIHPSTACDSDQLGEGNIIFHNVSIEHHCKVGDANIIWQNVAFPHHNRIGNFNNIAPAVTLSGYAGISNHCFVGNNVSVKNKIKINDYAYVGANAYISHEVPSRTVWVPMRSYQLTDKDPFDFL